MFKSKGKTLQTGLDIGSSSIKLVQLSGHLENLQLVNFDVIKLGQKADSVKKALADIAQKVPSKEVNISISGPAVVVRYIEMPKMSTEELKSSMKFEAEKHIPFNIKDVILDSQVIEQLGRGKIKVLLAAAKKDAVSERLELAESAGLFVNTIDCDSFALANAFLLNFPDISDDSNTALLNLGNRSTSINILKGKKPYFTRESRLGGWNFAKAISEALNMDMKAASELVENPGERSQELLEIAKPIAIHIIEEVKLSLNYYENQIGATVDKIYVSGGLSAFKGLMDLFNKSLEVDCKLWDPVKTVKIDKELPMEKLDKVKSLLPVALGLAIRG